MSGTTITSRTGSTGDAWQRYHQRAEAVRDVLDRLDSGASTTLPWDSALAAVFHDRDDLLEALHAVWTRRLLARVDLELELGTGHPRQSVEAGWRATHADNAALRAVLDRYAGTEVVLRCVAGEHRLLAVAAGLATPSDPAPVSARRGAELVEGFRRTTARRRSRHARHRHHRLGRLLGCRTASTAA